MKRAATHTVPWLVALCVACAPGVGAEPLTLVRTHPLDGTIDVDPAAPVAAVFSRPLEAQELAALSFSIAGVAGAVRTDCASVILEPDAVLATSRAYTVTVGGAVPASTFSFTTMRPVVAIAAGPRAAFAVLADGSLWAWGDDTMGQLGLTGASVATPTRVGNAVGWSAVAVGGAHTLALRDDGTLWAWGDDSYGQLGLGTIHTSPVRTPTRVGSASDWRAIAAGTLHSLALRNDGTVWAWGDGRSGALGAPESGPRAEPGQVAASMGFVAIAAGGADSFAVAEDGTLWAWGNDERGELGLDRPHPLSQTQPARVGSASDWRTVIAAVGHGLGLRTDASLWAWGLNDDGQLGNGSRTSRVGDTGLVPFSVSTPIAIQQVGTSPTHTVAVGADGTLYGWGQNDANQLGLTASVVESLLPTRLGTGSDWRAVAVGYHYTLALRTDGTVWRWGAPIPGDVVSVGSDAPVRVPVGDATRERTPASVRAAAGARTLRIDWESWNDDAAYEIELTSSTGEPATTIDCVTPPHTLVELTPGVTYTATVRARTFSREEVVLGSASATISDTGPPPGLCDAYDRDFCALGGPGTINYYVPRGCGCWPGTVDEGDAVLDELCGISGSGYGCKTCTCP